MRESLVRRLRRWVAYRVVSALVHQPLLLRLAACALRQWPWLGPRLGVVARRGAVVGVFERDTAFSNTSHAPNLPAGEFVIGLESCPRQAAERVLVASLLPSESSFAAAAAQESRRRIQALREGPTRRFDLIDDYLVPVAWQALRPAFGAAAPDVSPGDPLFAHLRAVGAHLIVGSVATEPVQRRALASGAQINACVRERLPQLLDAWQGAAPNQPPALLARTAVGMMWVAHPATVQAGALLMQELLARQPIHRALARKAQALADPWGDATLRDELRAHVLELLRFRPPFPILVRELARDARYESEGASPRAKAGSRMTLLTIGALFDPLARDERPTNAYRPGRGFKEPADHYLVFGHGARHCPARHQVVETLVSALAGLLTLPGLRSGDAWPWRRVYEGPTITRMRLKFKQG